MAPQDNTPASLSRVDWAQSLQIARQITAGPGADTCWEAAAITLLVLLGQPAGAHYVEGYLIVPDTDLPDALLPIEHGWVERANGTLLDPRQAAIREDMPGRPAPMYLPVRRYTAIQLLGTLRERARFPLMYAGGATPQAPDVVAARDLALQQTLSARERYLLGKVDAREE